MPPGSSRRTWYAASWSVALDPAEMVTDVLGAVQRSVAAVASDTKQAARKASKCEFVFNLIGNMFDDLRAACPQSEVGERICVLKT